MHLHLRGPCRSIEPWEGDEEEERPWTSKRRKKRKAKDWAALIRRSLTLDVLRCPACGGRMKLISTIAEPDLVRRLLRSMGLPSEIPPRAPPRSLPSEGLDFVP